MGKLMKIFKLKTIFLICTLILLSVGLYFLSTDSYTQAKFRTMQDPISSDVKVDLTGLKDLQASGGPIVNFSNLRKQLQHVDKKIIVVDAIRQYHGYINNGLFKEIPTTFLAYDRDDPDLRHWLRRLFITSSLKMRKDLVMSEKNIADKYGFEYVNLKIDSRIKTPDESVDQFVKFIDALPDKVWLHFHCRLGKGRTSMALVMLDIMKNAPQVGLEDIVKRQHLLGSENLFNTISRSGGTYYSSTLKKRKKFIEDFYAFICQRRAGGIETWSAWHKTQLQSNL
jgi:hypothetical protein